MSAPSAGTTGSAWRRLAILALVLLPIALHVGDSTARLLFRDLELAIDTNPEHHEPVGFIAVDGGAPIQFPPNESGVRSGVIPPPPERPLGYSRVEFRWNADSRTVSDVTVDREPLDPQRVVVVRDVAPRQEAFDFVVLRLPRTADGLRVPAIVALSSVLWLLLFAVFRPVLERRRALGMSALSLFTYSSAWARHLSRRDLAIGFVAAVVTVVSVVGGDAAPIYDIFRISAAGLDVYQYQVNFEALWHWEFPTFPYNVLMLEFWTFVDRFWGTLFAHAPLYHGEPYLQILMIKIVNAGLLLAMVLSILSFADEEKLLAGRPRLAFHLAIFAPVLWYVAILFVQFDTAPLFFVTLGMLLSHRFERHGLVGPLFIAIGCSMKVQGIALLPAASICFVYNALSSSGTLKTRIRLAALGLAIIGGILGIFRFLPARRGAPLQLLLEATPQLDRAYLGIPYAGDVVVYFLLASVTVILLFYVLSLRVGLESRSVIAGSILTSGAVVAALNAAHLFTPSTLLQMGGAITLVLFMERDPLRRVAFSAGTALIILSAATQPYGDITRIIPGRDGYFTHLVPKLLKERTLWNSRPMTVSVAALIAYAVLFWRAARKALDAPAEGDATKR